MAVKKPVVEPTTTYILELGGGGRRKVTVPSSWKTSFGPAVPYQNKNDRTEHTRGYALRFYSGNKEFCRAIFTDVKSYRDMSIPVEERVTERKQQVMQKEVKGGFKNIVVEASVSEWKNPDDFTPPSNEFLQLPKPDDDEF